MARIKPFEFTGTMNIADNPTGLGAGIGVWQLLPEFQQDEYFNQMTYEIVSNGPTGRFEVTNAPIDDVVEETANPGTESNVVGFPWKPGDVSVPTQQISPPPTAFRLVATAGIIEANGRATA